MTDTDTAPTRVWLTYVADEGGEVSLPGYLDAVPSVVAPGDVFSVAADLLERDPYAAIALVEDSRFEPADEPPDPFERRTKADLAREVGVDPDAYAKADLVTLARDRARMYPPVPGAAADPLEDEVPIPGQDVDPFAPDPDAGETADDDTPNGSEQA